MIYKLVLNDFVHIEHANYLVYAKTANASKTTMKITPKRDS